MTAVRPYNDEASRASDRTEQRLREVEAYAVAVTAGFLDIMGRADDYLCSEAAEEGGEYTRKHPPAWHDLKGAYMRLVELYDHAEDHRRGCHEIGTGNTERHSGSVADLVHRLNMFRVSTAAISPADADKLLHEAAEMLHLMNGSHAVGIVSEEMMDEGARVILECVGGADLGGFFDEKILARQVYEAMLAAANPVLSQVSKQEPTT